MRANLILWIMFFETAVLWGIADDEKQDSASLTHSPARHYQLAV